MERPAPIFLAQDADDIAVLREGGGEAYVVGERLGLVTDNLIVVARDGARDLLRGMNLGVAGRYIDTDRRPLMAYLADIVTNDPVGLLDDTAKDLYWHEERPICDWPVPELVNGKSSGFAFMDHYLRWTQPELGIILGPYGCGKSNLARLLAYKWADTIGREMGSRISVVGWEDKLAVVKREVERYALGGNVAGALSSEENARVLDMERRVGWTQRHPDDQRLIQWYCDLVEHRAKRDGVKFFVFDPFNEHDSTRSSNQTETEYVRDVMTRLRRLVYELGIVMIVVTHVSAKSYDESGKVKPFRTANAAGSVQFGNRCDRGICVLRTKALQEVSDTRAPQHMVLHFDKAKHEETMGNPGTIACVFDPLNMQLAFDRGASVEVRKVWP